MLLTTTQIDFLFERIQERVSQAHRDGSLYAILTKIGWQDLLEDLENDLDRATSYPTGKIVVLGASSVKKEHLLGIAKRLGFSKERFEFADFNETKTFNYRKLQCNNVYSVVLAGPMPHKTSGTGNSSSAIATMEEGFGYPRIVRLYAGNELKITKQSFKDCLINLCREGFLRAA